MTFEVPTGILLRSSAADKSIKDMKAKRRLKKSKLKKVSPRGTLTNKARSSRRLVAVKSKGALKNHKKGQNTKRTTRMNNKESTATSATNELSDAQPSTSRQAIALNRDRETSATSRIPCQKKPFKKFKDDKYRAAQIEKHKSKLSKKNLRNHLYLPTIATASPSQILSKKILRSIKKRKNTFHHQSQTVTNSNFKTKISMSPVQKDSIEPNEAEKEDLDDDCVCIDKQPEVILIDDETVTTNSIQNEVEDSSRQFKQYEPIGSMRNKSPLAVFTTSTPKLKLFSGNSLSRVPFYGHTIPTLGTMASDGLFAGISMVDKKEVDNDVVVIDDTLENSRTPKRKRPIEDDSIIFVSEEVGKTCPPTKAPAYIPLDTPVEESHFRSPIGTLKAKRPRNELFSSKEQKQLKQYNENAYNPNGDAPVLTKKRMVIVDGSNVAYHHALNKEFSVKGLKICLDYFEKMGHEVKAVVPQFRLQRQKSSDPSELERLHKEGKIVFTPCKNLPGKSSTSYDDRFVLQLATELDAAVVSNDNYRDLINENPAFKKIIENRVIGYTWCNDLFILPKDPYGKWGPTLATILNRT